jgi:hypothetical protein
LTVREATVTVEVMSRVIAAALSLQSALLLGGCSVLLDFDKPIGDGGAPPTIDAPMIDADPNAPDAPPDPKLLDEPNNDFASATPITPGTYGPLAIDPLGDHDFYKFTLTAASDVDVKIIFLETDGDLDLKLYDGTMTLTQPTSQGFMSNEEIIHNATMNGQLAAGDYYIEVYGYNNMYVNDNYVLMLTVM